MPPVSMSRSWCGQESAPTPHFRCSSRCLSTPIRCSGGVAQQLIDSLPPVGSRLSPLLWGRPRIGRPRGLDHDVPVVIADVIEIEGFRCGRAVRGWAASPRRPLRSPRLMWFSSLETARRAGAGVIELQYWLAFSPVGGTRGYSAGVPFPLAGPAGQSDAPKRSIAHIDHQSLARRLAAKKRYDAGFRDALGYAISDDRAAGHSPRRGPRNRLIEARAAGRSSTGSRMRQVSPMLYSRAKSWRSLMNPACRRRS
jgi:hypothetical protein